MRFVEFGAHAPALMVPPVAGLMSLGLCSFEPLRQFLDVMPQFSSKFARLGDVG